MPIRARIDPNFSQADRELGRVYEQLGQIWHRPSVRKKMNQLMAPVRTAARSTTPSRRGNLKRAVRTRISRRVKQGRRYHSQVQLSVGYESRSRNPVRYSQMLGAEFGNARFPNPTRSLAQALTGRQSRLISGMQAIVDGEVVRMNAKVS